MSDSFREVTRVSWFGRLRQSVLGVLFGLLLILAMVVLLFWNEGRAVTTARSLAEGAGLVVDVAADAIDAGNEGRLVHVAGPVSADEEPADPTFGIRAQGIRLERSVEMFQWREDARSETQTKVGGGQETVTTYTYRKDWFGTPIDSSEFRQPAGHSNPPMSFRSEDFQVPEARLGAFRLDSAVLARIGGAEAMPVGPDRRADIARALTSSLPVAIADGRIYLGEDPSRPEVGDHRVSYRLVPLGPVSVVGRQQANGLTPYPTEAGDRLLLVETGIVPAAEMFERAETANTVVTWVLRVAGLLLLVLGFALAMGPVGVLADVIPLLGRVVRLGTGAVAFVLGVLVGTVTMAVAWFWYRPLVALGIVLAGLAVAWLTGRIGAAKAPAPAAGKAG